MGQNIISTPKPQAQKITRLLLIVALLIVFALGMGVIYTHQIIYKKSSAAAHLPETPGFPPMYLLGAWVTPEHVKAQKGVTYKSGINSTLFAGFPLRIVWGNGRFRMVYDRVTVENDRKLPKELTDIRCFGYDFGFENGPKKTTARLVSSDSVTEDVRKIRYVNGILYCMGGDAPVYVDIKKEYWWIALHPESLPSPHKEEFAKLKGRDSKNMVWVPSDPKTPDRGNWVWEVGLSQ